jgi:hypothetical protein
MQAILNAVVAREVTARLCTGNNIIRTEGLGEWEPELRLVRPEVLSEDISPALKDIKAAGYTCTLPSEACAAVCGWGTCWHVCEGFLSRVCELG